MAYAYSLDGTDPVGGGVAWHVHGGAVLPSLGEARLFAGRLAGGRVCVSGTCRDLPPFEGVRADLTIRS